MAPSPGVLLVWPLPTMSLLRQSYSLCPGLPGPFPSLALALGVLASLTCFPVTRRQESGSYHWIIINLRLLRSIKLWCSRVHMGLEEGSVRWCEGKICGLWNQDSSLGEVGLEAGTEDRLCVSLGVRSGGTGQQEQVTSLTLADKSQPVLAFRHLAHLIFYRFPSPSWLCHCPVFTLSPLPRIMPACRRWVRGCCPRVVRRSFSEEVTCGYP